MTLRPNSATFSCVMAAEDRRHIPGIQAQRLIAQEGARPEAVSPLTPELQHIQRTAAGHLYNILDQLRNEDEEIIQFPLRVIENTQYLFGEGFNYTYRLRYGEKFNPTPGESEILRQSEALPGQSSDHVPDMIVSKDYFRTSLVTVKVDTVTVAHSPMEVYFPESKQWVKCTEEIFATADVARDPTIIYGAMDRLVNDVKHVTEVSYKGKHYWRKPRK